jgi:hypothetical protein
MRRMCIALLALAAGLGTGWANELDIENEASTSVDSVSIAVQDKVTKIKKPKKSQSIGLAAWSAPVDDDFKKPKKRITVDVTEDECVADVEFTLGNGKIVTFKDSDLCSTAGFIIEDVPDEAVTTAAAP